MGTSFNLLFVLLQINWLRVVQGIQQLVLLCDGARWPEGGDRESSTEGHAHHILTSPSLPRGLLVCHLDPLQPTDPGPHCGRWGQPAHACLWVGVASLHKHVV